MADDKTPDRSQTPSQINRKDLMGILEEEQKGDVDDEEPESINLSSQRSITIPQNEYSNIPLSKPPMPESDFLAFEDAENVHGSQKQQPQADDNFARVTWTDLAKGTKPGSAGGQRDRSFYGSEKEQSHPGADFSLEKQHLIQQDVEHIDDDDVLSAA